MDPITHCLVGGMTAKTVGTSNRRFWIMLLLGSAPDLDVIFSAFGHWAFWLQHRGISHSFFGVAAQALFYAWALQKWDKGPYKERALHYSFPLFLHMLCDYFTSFGVPAFSPFAFREYSADLMGGLALLPIIFMSVGLIRMYKAGTSGWNASRPLWAGWILYFMVAVSGKAYASKLTETHSASATTLPSIVNPFQWSAIGSDKLNHSYDYYQVDLFEGAVRPQRKFMMPESDFPIQSSINAPLVQEFLKDARWPVARVLTLEKGWRVEWGQILFSTRGVVRGKIQVDVDDKGKIISENKIFSFWNPAAA